MLPELLPALLLGGLFLVGAVGLMIWHVQTWRRVQAQGPETADYRYRRHQFRRRMQTTAMLALIAAALPIGVAVMRPWPRVGVFVWGGVLLLILWVVLLALADALASSQYYARLRNNAVVEEAKLQAELHRIQGLRRNGQAPGKSGPKPPDAGNGSA